MSDYPTELLTFHGWGFSSDIWQSWESYLPPDLRVQHAERGYFGEGGVPQFEEEGSHKVILTHSFGLHWCPRPLIEQADHLVIISGFLSFHPERELAERRSRLLFQQMMSRFVEKPHEVLAQFYRNTYSPSESPAAPYGEINGESAGEIRGGISHDRLLEDLGQLGTVRMGPEELHRIPALTLIHGEEDAIVSNRKGRGIYRLLNRRSRYLEVKHAGHAVPFTHPEICCKFLNPVLQHQAVGDL